MIHAYIYILGYTQGPEFFRRIEMHLDVGADAIDYDTIAKREKLKPMEIELRRLEKMVDEIVDDIEYLKRREAKMRDTNGTLITQLLYT
jgi:hypothetical protein